MLTAEYLRRQAETCLRIARGCFDLTGAERLRYLAADLKAKAVEIEEDERLPPPASGIARPPSGTTPGIADSTSAAPASTPESAIPSPPRPVSRSCDAAAAQPAPASTSNSRAAQDQAHAPMNTILTRLSAELIQQYEAEGFWRSDTIYGAGALARARAPDASRCATASAASPIADCWRPPMRSPPISPAAACGPASASAVWLPSRIESVVALLACSKSGAICCPSLHRDHTIGEVVELMQRTRCVGLRLAGRATAPTPTSAISPRR